jgi:hypothetical protein
MKITKKLSKLYPTNHNLTKYINKYSHTVSPNTPNELLNDVTLYSFGKYVNCGSGPFLSHIGKNQFDYINVGLLAHIISKDVMNFKYIPEKCQDKVLQLQNKDFFCDGTLYKMFDATISSKMFNKYFKHISLYIPFDKDNNMIKQQYIHMEYNPSDMGIGGGPWTQKFNHPIIWNIKNFSDYYRCEIGYVSDVSIGGVSDNNENDLIVNNKFHYLEISNNKCINYHDHRYIEIFNNE